MLPHQLRRQPATEQERAVPKTTSVTPTHISTAKSCSESVSVTTDAVAGTTAAAAATAVAAAASSRVEPSEVEAPVKGEPRKLDKADREIQQRKMEDRARGRQAVRDPNNPDRILYEWEQDLRSVIVHVTPPQGVAASDIDCKISSAHLRLGLKGLEKAYLDVDLIGKVVAIESVWTMSDGVIEIELVKMKQGRTWTGCFVGHQGLDGYAMEQQKKKQMLERFQGQYPGFDFSGAKFDGMAPEPSEFMGGFEKQ